MWLEISARSELEYYTYNVQYLVENSTLKHYMVAVCCPAEKMRARGSHENERFFGGGAAVMPINLSHKRMDATTVLD